MRYNESCSAVCQGTKALYEKWPKKQVFLWRRRSRKIYKNLKAYGVLKSVKNTDDQLEMSDLVDDDIEITDETAESGDCLYVFTYVGVTPVEAVS